MARRRKNGFISLVCLIIGLFMLVLSIFSFDSTQEFSGRPLKHSNMKESDYVNMYCKGIIEYQLPDRTRIDCLTDEYAIEYDWAKKWAESIGQSMYYSQMTGKKPAVAIIIKTPEERVYINRIKKANKDITVFEIKAENYTE